MGRHLSAATADPHELDDPAGFAERVRRTHRATNRGRDEHGRRQLPWPRALGTQPWALARHLGGGGRAYRVRIDHPRERGRDFDEVVAAVRAGYPAALYIGDHVAPRHVVLAFAATPDGSTLRSYDPSAGGEVAIARSAYVDAHLSVAGWDEPWLAVLPV